MEPKIHHGCQKMAVNAIRALNPSEVFPLNFGKMVTQTSANRYIDSHQY
jgi:hypothetical protein